MGCEDVQWIKLVQNTVQQTAFVNTTSGSEVACWCRSVCREWPR